MFGFLVRSVAGEPVWISDAFFRRLIQRLRDISKRADLQISETSPGTLIKGVCSEASVRLLMFSHRYL